MEYTLTGKKISLSKSRLLLEGFQNMENWTKIGNVPWEMKRDILTGGRRGETEHGQLFYGEIFSGDILMEFDAWTIPPSTHDIIWWWRSELECGKWGRGYLGALAGWWRNKAGIEKMPDCRLNAVTPLFAFEPGRKYHIVSGSIGGHCFIFADGSLIIELHDPEPFPPAHSGHIGFGVFQSSVSFENLKVYFPYWEIFTEKYI